MQSKSRKEKGGRKHFPTCTCFLLLGGLLVFWPANFAKAQQQTPSSLPGQSGATAPSSTTEEAASGTPATGLQSGPQQSSPQASPGPGIGTTAANLQFVEVRASSNLSRITGPARERSFLTDGNNNAVDVSYLEDFTRGMQLLEVVSVLRYTDDIRTDPERNSVQRAYLRISGPRSEFNFGDYLVNYTRLTHNQNLKGFHFIRSASWGQGFRLLGNVGTFTDRYGSLFRKDLPGKPFTRVVSGLRAEQKIGQDKTIALNWSYGNDRVSSLPLDTPFRPVANNVASLDARMRFFNAWNLEGEIAYSSTNFDTRSSEGNCKDLPIRGECKDYALRFDNSVRKGPWNFAVYFTRIMPSFSAINARQVADLQDLQARASVQLGERVSLQGSYRRTNDDLRRKKPQPGTVFQIPEVRLSIRAFSNTLIDIGYKERRQEQSGFVRPIDRVTRTNPPISQNYDARPLSA